MIAKMLNLHQTEVFATLLLTLSRLLNDQIIPCRFDNFFCHGLRHGF
jgi:hypothetical protein